MNIYRLENPIQRYAWGSSDGISSTLGIPNPSGGPLAELWMGAHPSAPSIALRGGERVPLDSLVAEDPRRVLGSRCVERLGPRLPFLFKALSAGTPLSIQAHPGRRKAERGWDRENLSGLPADAPERNYRDPYHKPEMAIALTHFEMLCGFRPIPEIISNIAILAPREKSRLVGKLERSPGRVELSVFFYGFITAEQRVRQRLLDLARGRIDRLLATKAIPAEREAAFRWISRLMDTFPGDVGALAPLILNHVVLEPGEASFIAPGELHAHLTGTCLEIMANSDNVIRGGLTKKHIDVPELVSVLTFDSEHVLATLPERVSDAEESYPVFVPDFHISRIRVEPSKPWRGSVSGPEILLCTSGSGRIGSGSETILMSRGESVFVEHAAESYEIAAADGEAVFYRATVPDIP
jgi:mannose-6-phosphate isomerase